MTARGPELNPLEQQLVRFALENDGEFRISAAQLREAINTGEADIPGKGPISKGSALLDILENKERITGGSSPEEVALARQIVEEKVAGLEANARRRAEEG